MNEAEKVLQVILIPRDQTPEVLQPGKQAFNLPTPAIATQAAAILSARLGAVGFVRRDQLNALVSQAVVQRVAVIGLIPNQPFGNLVEETTLESGFHKGDFMRCSRRKVNGERNTSTVCHRHELRTLAPLGLSHAEAPFFAATKVPSIKHSDKSNSPRCFKSSARASSTCRSTLDLTQCWNRRLQVWYGGKRSGRSAQGAPVRITHRIPWSTSRVSRHGRPRP